MNRRTLGVIGGGEMSRMMTLSAHRLGIRLAVLDPQGSASPAGQISSLCVQGNLQDYDKLEELAQISDVLTIEGENIDVDALELLEKAGPSIHPDANTLRIMQNRLLQKEHLQKHNIPVTDTMECPDEDAVIVAGSSYGYPLILKTCNTIPDRTSKIVVENSSEIKISFEKLGAFDIYAEKFVSFAKELSVVAVKTTEQVYLYPLGEIRSHNDKYQHIVIAPAQISRCSQENAVVVAKQAVSSLNDIGVYTVELFLLNDDSVLVNNILAGPHTSGNYSLEACDIDQFEMHLRAVFGLPCPTPAMKVPFAMSIQLVGQDILDSTKAFLHNAMTVPSAKVHWYGKYECQLGKTVGHVTITGNTIAELRQRAELLGITPETHGLPTVPVATVGILLDNDAILPIMQHAASTLERFQIPYELKLLSPHRTPTSLYAYAQTATERGIQVIIAGASETMQLPSMLASLTSVPIIGVPIQSVGHSPTCLSVASTSPVATVGVNCALEAGLLAVRILGVQDESLVQQMDAFMLHQEEEVLHKANELDTLGYTAYLAKHFRS